MPRRGRFELGAGHAHERRRARRFRGHPRNHVGQFRIAYRIVVQRAVRFDVRQSCPLLRGDIGQQRDLLGQGFV